MIEQLKAALASRGIELVHAADGREALRLVLERIPKGATVMNGGSATLEDIGLLDALGSSGYKWLRPAIAATNERAERTRRELLATGETARRRTVQTGTQLTAQEAQVARLALDGLSNPEIGARLFISPRTVQYHLRKVFTKLDITARVQLARVLPSEPIMAPRPH